MSSSETSRLQHRQESNTSSKYNTESYSLPLTRQLDEFVWLKLNVKLGFCKAGTENLMLNLRVLVAGTGTNLVVCTLKPPGSWYCQY